MSQFARPISDISKTNCFVYPDTLTYVYETMDEAAYDESDYTRANDADAIFTVALSALVDPRVHSGHVLRVRHRCPAAVSETPVGTASIFRLYQGETLIAEWTATKAYPSITEAFPLTEEQAASITDYGALRFYGWLDSYHIDTYYWNARVYWVELEVPDAIGCGLGMGMVA